MSVETHLIAELPSAFTLAAIDFSWIFIAFAAISVISKLLKKQGEEPEQDPWAVGEDTPAHPPAERRRTTSPAPQKISNWEEELKRVLEGQIPTTSSPPPPLPPPIVIVEKRPPPPPPVEVKAAPRPSRVRVDKSTNEDEAGGRLAKLSEAATTQARASHLQMEMARRFQQVDQLSARGRQAAPLAHGTAPSAEVAAIRQMFRNPATVRQAVVASLILGPPRALEA